MEINSDKRSKVLNLNKKFAQTSYESWNGVKEILINVDHTAKVSSFENQDQSFDSKNPSARLYQYQESGGDYADDIVNTGLVIPPKFKQSLPVDDNQLQALR